MNETDNIFERDYLRVIVSDFHCIKRLGEKAMDQLEIADYHWSPDAESNSLAVLIQHLNGNMVSRWTDFLTTDGEKPSRKRDSEFVDEAKELGELKEQWDRGWACVFAALDAVSETDLIRTVYIRGKTHTVVEAINQSMWHYASHIGQILYLAKQRRGAEWKSLSIPRGKSSEYFRERGP